jgi:hypothetical protein
MNSTRPGDRVNHDAVGKAGWNLQGKLRRQAVVRKLSLFSK